MNEVMLGNCSYDKFVFPHRYKYNNKEINELMYPLSYNITTLLNE